MRIGYHPGPENIRAELWDDPTRTHTTWDRAGTQTSQRPYTAEENAEADALANEATLRGRAEAALTGNETYLARATPTNAQVAAQVRALTQQNSVLIRLVLRRLDATT